MNWYVKILAFDEKDDIPKRLGPYDSERIANRADDGVNRNLDHERYYTIIKKEE